MNDLILLGLFAGIAVAISLFLGAFFLFIKEKDKFQNNILGLLFIAVGLRISKSIFYFIFDYTVLIGLAVGLFALASIGPLLYLYIRSTRKETKLHRKLDALHFILPVLGFVVILLFRFLGEVLYKGTTVLLLIYILFSLFTILKQKKEFYEDIYKWNTKIIGAISIICIAFIYQHLTEHILDYAIGAGIASLPIYYVFIYALKSPVIFSKPNNKRISSSVLEKVKNAIEKDKIFLTAGITLNQFSEDLNIPAYLVTKSIKELYGKNFPESINYNRVQNIKLKLIEEKNYNTKIEVLAYEGGFKSLSVFYTAFKKITGMSPNQFKEDYFIHNN